MRREESPQLRHQACDLAPIDWVRAVAIADQIADPWYACQAFAWCGRFAPVSESSRLIEQSFRQAQRGKDAYRQLAATAWPLRALVELGRMDEALCAFDGVAGIVSDVEPPSSRSEACFLIFQALATGPRELGIRVWDWLLIAVLPAEHWRQERAVRVAAIQAVTLGLIEASDLPRFVKDEGLLRKIADRVERGEKWRPREFFWVRGQTGDS